MRTPSSSVASDAIVASANINDVAVKSLDGAVRCAPPMPPTPTLGLALMPALAAAATALGVGRAMGAGVAGALRADLL